MCRFKSFGKSTHGLLNFSPDIALSVGGPESLARRSNWDVKALSIIPGKPPGLYLEAESPVPPEWEMAEPVFVLWKAEKEQQNMTRETRDRFLQRAKKDNNAVFPLFPAI